ncbi:hypothetical protein [Mycobacterium sp. NPDC050853]|uniref:hypothetical protein n=1 Tax=Mycobacterium sp. NPDC050853 TaxID=3155160 RepID=UPI0033C54647
MALPREAPWPGKLRVVATTLRLKHTPLPVASRNEAVAARSETRKDNNPETRTRLKSAEVIAHALSKPQNTGACNERGLTYIIALSAPMPQLAASPRQVSRHVSGTREITFQGVIIEDVDKPQLRLPE